MHGVAARLGAEHGLIHIWWLNIPLIEKVLSIAYTLMPSLDPSSNEETKFQIYTVMKSGTYYK